MKQRVSKDSLSEMFNVNKLWCLIKYVFFLFSSKCGPLFMLGLDFVLLHLALYLYLNWCQTMRAQIVSMRLTTCCVWSWEENSTALERLFSNSTTVLRIPAKKICMQLFECAASAHKSRTIFSKDALSIVTNFIQNRWTISSIAVPFSLRHKMKGKKTSKPNCLDIKRKVYIVSWYYSVRLFSKKKSHINLIYF